MSILIALGANLPTQEGSPPLATCRAALACLAALPELRLVAASGWWRSAPVPPSSQPLFVNGVALFDARRPIDPAALLARLHGIESRFGRQREHLNASRTLDLDIIAIGQIIRCHPDPVLPHPRAHLRAFVLAPLLEIAPDWVHPSTGRSGADLLAELADQPRQRI